MIDFTLAVTHHVVVFALLAVLVAELALVRYGMDAAAVDAVGRIDLGYGALAAIALAVGLARAVYAAKGWDFYSHSLFFWLKLGVFVLIGVLSVPPTIKFIQWRRAQHVPTDAQIKSVRTYFWLELALFAALPVCAAAMARGYGYYA